MKLTTKFNFVLVTVLTLSLLGTAALSYTILQKGAQDEVIYHASIMMEAALAIRNYTAGEIKPLLEQQKDNFLPQSVPAYAVTQSFNQLRVKHPEYHYKEATLNPTNLKNKAIGWESDIIQEFRNKPGSHELIGVRSTPNGQSLYLARPIRVENRTCLSCHGDANAAPTTMITRYGGKNGFGWQLYEVVGAQIISVPMSVPINDAQETFFTFMAVVIGIFVLTMVVLNIMLHQIVIKPITRMAVIADQISLGKLHVGEFREKGTDEISMLGASFNRLRRSLVKAMKMLEDSGT